MIDMAKTVVPKSDQLNADDLIAGPRTIVVTGIRGLDNAEQPIAISFDGDGGKSFRPCKSMRRVLIHCWGADGSKYVGRAMTLFCDPEVQYGGMKVGGIRISHMSHIERETVMALTATKAKRKPYVVHPLAMPDPQHPQQAATQAPQTGDKQAAATERVVAQMAAAASVVDVAAVFADAARKDWRAKIANTRPDLAARIDEAERAALDRIEAADAVAGEDDMPDVVAEAAE